MISNMIPISSKYHKIINPVIQAVPIDVMYNMIRQQSKVFGSDLSAPPLSVAVAVIRSLLFGVKISVVAFMRAVKAFSITDMAACAADYLAARLAGYIHPLILSRVDPVALEQLPDALSGSTVSFGKVDHRHKVNCIGGDDVNFVFRCQSGSHISSKLRVNHV